MSNIPKDTKQIEEAVWEIPTSFKQGMNVPARIFATKKLLDAMDPGVFEQLTNMACLPGVQKYALAMPDAHWGYGFCVSLDTEILSEFGYYLPIKDFENYFEKLKCYEQDKKEIVSTEITKFMKIKPKNKIMCLTTKAGNKLIATEDHPFYTKEGMIQIKNLSLNDRIAIYPFKGIKYKIPSNDIIISEEDITNVLESNNIKKGSWRYKIIINKLNSRGLIPLKYNSKQVPYILKLMGFLLGDASINFIGKRGDGILNFSGQPCDLEKAREDIKAIGYNPSRVYSKIRNGYEDNRFIVNASSLVILFEALGVPKGTKTEQQFRIPQWIFKSELWQKRLFLAALFGSELRSPHKRANRKHNFIAPTFPFAKLKELEGNAIDYLSDVNNLLLEFNIKTTCIQKHREIVTKKGRISSQLELVISPSCDNLIELWSKIGFEYNKKRTFLANVVVQYLKRKNEYLNKKKSFINKIRISQNNGISYRKISEEADNNGFYSKTGVREICVKLEQDKKLVLNARNFISFDKYLEESTQYLGNSGLIWEEIEEIKEVAYDDFVYDFTVKHNDHNFIANNFLVSNCIGGVIATDAENGGVISPGGVGFDINCGMRLITTNLTIKDVQPKLKELVNTFFQTVPSGVGCKGFVKINNPQFTEVMEEGVKWCVDNGYGWQEDLERIESNGKIEWADSSKISDKARQRGINQLGTLGSGNHYLEIQHVKPENIVDKELAKKFGIFPDQIVVMFHTGSRGFGHQTATDYLKIFEGAMKKYNISVEDPELACAPFNSPEGQDYYKAMACAANMSFSNRQVILHRIREGFEKVFKQKAEDMEMHCVYDVAHNLARLQEFKVDGKKKKLIVHRKGATLCQGPGNPEISKLYRDTGSPVIIGGSMETGSYLLVGTEKADNETFSSTAHGSGRTMSRHQAKREFRGDQLQKDMEKRGIYVKSGSMSGLAEEAGSAYKEINDVIDALAKAGISKPVTKLIPIGNVK